jgi:hypothetical protein
VAIPALFGVVIATGTLTIGGAIFAAAAGYALGDLYALTFPSFRGSAGRPEIPPAVYAIFVAYVVGAAEIAILYRRRVVKAGRGT